MRPMTGQPYRQRQESAEFEEKVVRINRVSKKTKGGNKIGFAVLMVVGDRKGRVGVALGKAPDTLSAIKKAARRARKELIKVPMRGTTIPFPIRVKHGAAEVLLKPAPPGTGVIAGGAVRAVVEAAGIHDVVAKILGSANQASNVYATFEALTQKQRIARRKGIGEAVIQPKAEPKPEETLAEQEKRKTNKAAILPEKKEKKRTEKPNKKKSINKKKRS